MVQTLSDIIAEIGRSDIQTICYRCNYPDSLREEFSDEDFVAGMLAGVARLEAGQVISEDGDDYALTDALERYEWDADGNCLTVWYHAIWSCDTDEI